MDGKTTGFAMQPLTRTDLVGPLSRIVRKKCPQIDLLVGVVDKHKAGKFSEISASLAANLAHNLKDTCCVFLHQLSPSRWKVLTTHGNAKVFAIGEDFEIKICRDNQTPRETPILRQLINLRSKLISQSLGLSKQIDIPYPEIRGNVLLCGDFSLWDPISLLALREIFIANRASSVVFATPAISRDHYHKLVQKGCNIVCLRPSEEIKV
ncbi:hypothetical protein KKE19_01720 [Patescibacteria group bacterium]|nr:hypothetical protein [Patescibacteria group bacterium]MBU4367416.1 hypothetical protein [Patescibacteria group bacterium]MBU4461736.1 hypothetical protein [Patescibacteria group bacterium]MCG2700120.1 hypothetical protein [Candidatus Parcubacteria bacterium]